MQATRHYDVCIQFYTIFTLLIREYACLPQFDRLDLGIIRGLCSRRNDCQWCGTITWVVGTYLPKVPEVLNLLLDFSNDVDITK